MRIVGGRSGLAATLARQVRTGRIRLLVAFLGIALLAQVPTIPVVLVSSTYASTVVADAPSHYYRLGETSGTVIADSSGHDRHATSHIAYLGYPGALANDTDKAVYFYAAYEGWWSHYNAYIVGQSGSEAGLATGNTARTVEGWVKTGSSNLPLAAWGAGANEFAVRVEQTSVGIYRGSVVTQLPADRILNDNAWHHVVVTYDSTTATLFVDGVERSSAALPTLTTEASPPSLGYYFDNAAAGLLDEVAIYPTALSARQVYDHFEVVARSAPDGRSQGSRS